MVKGHYRWFKRVQRRQNLHSRMEEEHLTRFYHKYTKGMALAVCDGCGEQIKPGEFFSRAYYFAEYFDEVLNQWQTTCTDFSDVQYSCHDTCGTEFYEDCTIHKGYSCHIRINKPIMSKSANKT